MKNHLKFFGLLLYGTLLGTSCVNDEYDMNKEFDHSCTILRNVSIPIGDLGKQTLDDILDIDDSHKLIKVNDNGDYALSFIGDKIAYNLEDLKFTIPAEELTVDPMSVLFPTSAFKYSGSSLVNEQLVYSELTGTLLQSSLNIGLYTEFPSEITDVREIDLNSEVNISFSTNVGQVYAKSGFSLTFPENMRFTKVGNSHDYTLSSSGNVIVLSKDVAFSADKPFVINLKFDSMTVPAGSISDGRLQLNEQALFNGDFYLKTQEFSSKPSSLAIQITPEISDIEIESIEAKFDIEHNIDDNNILITEVPRFLKGDNFVLDFYNPTILLDITNSTPLAFELGAQLVSQVAQAEKVVVNPFGSDDATLSVQANSDHTSYLISRRAMVTNSSVVNIVVPQLCDLIRTIPDYIGFNNIKVISDTDDYVTVTSDQTLKTEMGYEMNVPLSFGEDMKLDLQYNLDNLGLVFDAHLKNTVVKLDFTNSIPLTFTLTAIALDKEGNIVEGMHLTADNQVIAGTHLSPVSSTIKINIANASKKFEMNSLRLGLSAEASPEHIGIALNKNQGIQIDNVSFALPDGIDVKLGSSGDNE